MEKKRYWVSTNSAPWHEVTEKEYIEFEKEAGVHMTYKGHWVPTTRFKNETGQGKVTIGEITEEKYPGDQEFLKTALAANK